MFLWEDTTFVNSKFFFFKSKFGSGRDWCGRAFSCILGVMLCWQTFYFFSILWDQEIRKKELEHPIFILFAMPSCCTQIWVENDNTNIFKIQKILQGKKNDVTISMLVEGSTIRHYFYPRAVNHVYQKLHDLKPQKMDVFCKLGFLFS